jgi:hypothetical protein
LLPAKGFAMAHAIYCINTVGEQGTDRVLWRLLYYIDLAEPGVGGAILNSAGTKMITQGTDNVPTQLTLSTPETDAIVAGDALVYSTKVTQSSGESLADFLDRVKADFIGVGTQFVASVRAEWQHNARSISPV